MSADRYRVADYGTKLLVTDSKDGDSVAILRDKMNSRGTLILAGAIRQQARDIAELEVFAEIGRQWNSDSSLAKWFPLTAERVERDAQEIAKLRADLAAAVTRAEQAEARLAAIGSAPVVATVVDIGDECGPNPNVTFYSCQLPPVGTELIARPAKD